MRGSRLHGWGQSGQHRDSGSQGGRGKSGTFKHKWSSVVRYGQFEKVGFTNPNASKEPTTINVGELGLLASSAEGQDKKTPMMLDLTKLGYGKLLGRGSVEKPLKIKVSKFSKSAAKKIEAAGGSMASRD